jgi:hypothetical protein
VPEVRICDLCHLPHEGGTGCRAAMEKAMTDLLNNVGTKGFCRGCQAPVYWVTHKNKKPTPYDTSGLNHFVSCDKREQFRKEKANA